MRAAVAGLMGAVCIALCACQGPHLPLANAHRFAVAEAPPAPPPASSPQARSTLRSWGSAPRANESRARSLSRTLIGHEGERGRSPYRPDIDERQMRLAHDAVQLRMEARRPRYVPCGPIHKAERMKMPDFSGSDGMGMPVNPFQILHGLHKLFTRGRLP